MLMTQTVAYPEMVTKTLFDPEVEQILANQKSTTPCESPAPLGTITWGKTILETSSGDKIVRNPAMSFEHLSEDDRPRVHLVIKNVENYHLDPNIYSWDKFIFYPSRSHNLFFKKHDANERGQLNKMEIPPEIAQNENYKIYVDLFQSLANLWNVCVETSWSGLNPMEISLVISRYPFYIFDPDRFIRIFAKTLIKLHRMNSYQKENKFSKWSPIKAKMATAYASYPLEDDRYLRN